MFIVAACFVVAFLALPISYTQTQQDGNKWYPSEWGPQDQRGAVNRITPAKVLETLRIPKEGKVYQLGKVYEQDMPLFGTRHYSLRIPQTFGPIPQTTNNIRWHEEIVSGELGQIGTQFDGLGHVGIGDLFYNGFDRREFAKSEGLDKLGIENVGVFVTRGVLIDVAGYKGVERLDKGQEISDDDLKKALTKQKISIRPGDVVITHTGWGSLWKKDNALYNSGQPGIGLAAGKYLVEQKIAMIGSDTWGVEVVPNPDSKLAFPVHQLLLTKNGIYIIENLLTEDLAKDKVYEFAFIFAPLRLKGATGSPGNPIAIK